MFVNQKLPRNNLPTPVDVGNTGSSSHALHAALSACLDFPCNGRNPHDDHACWITLASTCFVPKSAGFCVPLTFKTATRCSCTACWSHNVGVAMCLMRPAPFRDAIPRHALASMRISTGFGKTKPKSSPRDLNPNPIDALFTAA